MTTVPRIFLACLVMLISCDSESHAQDATAVRATMKNAARYFAEEVSQRGGYVYYYSPDLRTRFGEGRASATQVWVQAPGTPHVGRAYLTAWRATGDRFYLDAATAAADALIYGQLKSGGWTNSIEFDSTSKRTALYRNGKGRGRNYSTFDDGITQDALTFLIQVDAAHNFRNKRIHECARFGLNAALNSQYANGAFPQVFDGGKKHASDVVTRAARFPDYDWKTENRIKEYWYLYTLNDGAAGTIVEMLQTAINEYNDPRARDSLTNLGRFLIAAQMPNPQPAWCQQYSFDMHPAWARRFEPPAIASRESQDVIQALMQIALVTRNDDYLKPIPRALKFLQQAKLPDGQLARYYELKSNKPLYMSRRGKTYSLTYDDSRLPSHYGWKCACRVDELTARLQTVRQAIQSENSSATQSTPAHITTTQSGNDEDNTFVPRRGEENHGRARFSIALDVGVFRRTTGRTAEIQAGRKVPVECCL